MEIVGTTNAISVMSDGVDL